MTSSYKDLPPQRAFIVYSLGQCVLLAVIAKLHHMFFFNYLPYALAALGTWYLFPAVRAYAQIPEFALEAYRRITMFSEPPVMEFEPAVFPNKNQSSYAF